MYIPNNSLKHLSHWENEREFFFFWIQLFLTCVLSLIFFRESFCLVLWLKINSSHLLTPKWPLLLTRTFMCAFVRNKWNVCRANPVCRRWLFSFRRVAASPCSVVLSFIPKPSQRDSWHCYWPGRSVHFYIHCHPHVSIHSYPPLKRHRVLSSAESFSSKRDSNWKESFN